MSLDNIKEILIGGGGIIFVLMTIVQITPIKINPWTWIWSHINKVINGDMYKRFDALDKKVDKVQTNINTLRDECEEREASLCRTHILNFSDEMLHGVTHSQEHFHHILVDISNYEQYCENHPLYLNNIAKASIEQIKKEYQKCLETNNFL